MAAMSTEPARTCLVVDKDDDVWRHDGREWVCQTESAYGTWDTISDVHGPLRVYAPTQTDDGAATPGQSSGGSSPGSVPEASEVVSGPAPSSPSSNYGHAASRALTDLWPVQVPQSDDGAGPPPADAQGASNTLQPAPTGESAAASATAPSSSLPRTFLLWRHVDISGVSGTGPVAEGCQFVDGSVALRWRGDNPATAVWPDLDSMLAVHGHQGATEIQWIDDTPIPLWPAEGGLQ